LARNIQTFKPIDESAAFADLDFDPKNFDGFFAHFYEFIVDGIQKNGDNVEIPATYCITLDETNCAQICDETQIRYDEILLFDTPVFYFIFVDVKAVFSCLRGENVAVVKLPEIEIIEDVESEPIEISKPESIPNKFIVNDGIATDNETGLMWLRFAYGQRWENGIKGTAKLLNSEQALIGVKLFNPRVNYAGHNDWRIPTISELKTLIGIEPDIFPNDYQKETKFWSSTHKDDSAWIVDFNNGNATLNIKTNKNHVRLVRSGQ